MRQMVDKRIDGGPCPRLVPLKDWPEAPAVPPRWKDCLMEAVYGPDGWMGEEVYGHEFNWPTGPITIGPDISEYWGDYIYNDFRDRDDPDW